MSRIVYCNGRYLQAAHANISVMDRAFLFADAVYEVYAIMGGALVDEDRHSTRLQRSLRELDIAPPMAPTALAIMLREVVRRNRVQFGMVYLQISRGAPPVRDHAWAPGLSPTVVAFARAMNERELHARAALGIAVVTVPESRWARCDIKSTSLLPNVLAKQHASAHNAREAWFVDPAGLVTEGSSSNAWIVDAQGVLRTRDLSANILPGVTRAAILDAAHEMQMPVEEGPFSVADVLAAREAFVTSAMSLVTPVIAINGQPIGDGRPGPIAMRLRAAYITASRSGHSLRSD